MNISFFTTQLQSVTASLTALKFSTLVVITSLTMASCMAQSASTPVHKPMSQHHPSTNQPSLVKESSMASSAEFIRIALPHNISVRVPAHLAVTAARGTTLLRLVGNHMQLYVALVPMSNDSRFLANLPAQVQAGRANKQPSSEMITSTLAPAQVAQEYHSLTLQQQLQQPVTSTDLPELTLTTVPVQHYVTAAQARVHPHPLKLAIPAQMLDHLPTVVAPPVPVQLTFGQEAVIERDLLRIPTTRLATLSDDPGFSFKVQPVAGSYGVRFDGRVINITREYRGRDQYIHGVARNFNDQYNLYVLYYYFADKPEDRSDIFKQETFINSLQVDGQPTDIVLDMSTMVNSK